ncbi:MAG: hypothetical protein M1824_002404 [Vezdaea acicularis]|nr:MAG: hypothetical protein M1824_002404 [Vezdaea acicularis]
MVLIPSTTSLPHTNPSPDTASSSSTPTPLFGGAITVDLPPNFLDVSDIRQVPSHQEVFLSSTSLSSITLDILEYQTPATISNASNPAAQQQNPTPTTTVNAKAPTSAEPTTEQQDLAALEFHISDIVDLSSNSIMLLPHPLSPAQETPPSPSPIPLPCFPAHTPAYLCSLHTSPHPPPPDAEPLHGGRLQREEELARGVDMWVLLVRLAGWGTDLLVCVNIPLGAEGKEGVEGREEGERWMQRIVQTLEVRDWSLFDGGEETVEGEEE